MSTPPTKPDLRNAMRTTLRAMPASHAATNSTALLARLATTPRISTPRQLLAFLPTAGEPEITPFIAQRLQSNLPTALPRANWDTNTMDPVLVNNLSTDCEPTRYSILQPRADLLPLAPATLDVILVPGVAFDATGARLGRGGGFYDRFLAVAKAAHPGVVFAGICFDEQVVDFVPVDAHDVRVDMILTPTRTLIARAHN